MGWPLTLYPKERERETEKGGGREGGKEGGRGGREGEVGEGRGAFTFIGT